jgi:peroxiredoxin Q/BCP
MVELRKRKAPPPPPVPAKKKAATGMGRKPGRPKKADEVKPAEDTTKKADDKPAKAEDDADAPPAAPEVGASVDLDSFGGEVETHDGKKTTLKQLVEESKAGVVLFTYPKANTPGCKLLGLYLLASHIFVQAPSRRAASVTATNSSRPRAWPSTA